MHVLELHKNVRFLIMEQLIKSFLAEVEGKLICI